MGGLRTIPESSAVGAVGSTSRNIPELSKRHRREAQRRNKFPRKDVLTGKRKVTKRRQIGGSYVKPLSYYRGKEKK